MQGYGYSIFSAVAIVIHLMINFDLIFGRSHITAHGAIYRRFLIGLLVYYITDAAWGVFAGLGCTSLLYVDTVLFFLSLAVFAMFLGHFVAEYISLGKWASRLLRWSGYAILATNVLFLVANVFNGCVFYFDDQGKYLCGPIRDPLFYLLIVFNSLISIVVFVKTVCIRDSAHSRIMMVLVLCLTLTVSLILQVPWPLTPFTSLGCLIGSCFFHVFVIRDEQMARHMANLEKALERARVAEKARSMFFSIVSHDIRTPLNAILGYSELLQNGVQSQAEKDEALESIQASGTTLLQLVNDVLDLAKMDAGKLTLQLAPVQLGHLTSEVFATFRLSASKKGIELVNRASGVPPVMLDGHRFRQILFNLVGNAVKFTERGSVTVAASYSDSNLEVVVSDTGCGIAPDMLTRVLDPFVQVQDPTHSVDRANGTGLGLSICKSLVEVMGGDFVVKSEIGKGSEFTVRIPGVATGEAVQTSVPETKRANDGLKHMPHHVLVVDDSKVNRSVLAALLKKAGVTSVDFACDGVEALSKLDSATRKGRPYDFVFSDFWMPNMNGIELIEKIRGDSRFRRLPVFAVTADTEFRHESRARLFTGILLKPLTYDKLVKVFSDIAQESI